METLHVGDIIQVNKGARVTVFVPQRYLPLGCRHHLVEDHFKDGIHQQQIAVGDILYAKKGVLSDYNDQLRFEKREGRTIAWLKEECKRDWRSLLDEHPWDSSVLEGQYLVLTMPDGPYQNPHMPLASWLGRHGEILSQNVPLLLKPNSPDWAEPPAPTAKWLGRTDKTWAIGISLLSWKRHPKDLEGIETISHIAICSSIPEQRHFLIPPPPPFVPQFSLTA